jgi:hypothetical protein
MITVNKEPNQTTIETSLLGKSNTQSVHIEPANAFGTGFSNPASKFGLVMMILCMLILPPVAGASGQWSCVEMVRYSVYEDLDRLEGQIKETTKTLEWIDSNTIGFDSLTHKRSGSKSNTFIYDATGSSMYINDKETPYLLVLTQPQTWMNKFGNLRVRFYRCSDQP